MLAFVPKLPGSKTRVCLRVPAIESLPLGRLAGLYSAAREEEEVVVVVVVVVVEAVERKTLKTLDNPSLQAYAKTYQDSYRCDWALNGGVVRLFVVDALNR